MSDAMNNEPSAGGAELERAAAAVRGSAGSLAPSRQAIDAVLVALAARQTGAGRAVVSSGRGGLSLTEDALMKKWRFHDAFRPLSFESLERRRLLAATTMFQDDVVDRRIAWPDCIFLNLAHARGDRPQRRWDSHPEPRAAVTGFETASDNVFGSELIFAA